MLQAEIKKYKNEENFLRNDLRHISTRGERKNAWK